MKKRKIFWVICALLAFSAGSAFAASITIVNGDFETGSDNDAPPAGWTDNIPTGFWLGVPGETGNPTQAEADLAPAPGLGNFFLTTARQSAGAGSQPVDGQLVQTVDLSALATEIDAGAQTLNIDFIYASDDDRDTGTFSLHFFSSTDGSGTELGSGYSVNLDAGTGYAFSDWQEMTVGGLVPVSARSVTLQIDTTRSGGSETNIWVDNISISDAACNPSPANGAASVDLAATLSWDAPSAYTGATYDVYFGTTEPNFLLSAPYGLSNTLATGTTVTTAIPVPSPLATDTTYYWVVDTLEPNTVGTILHQGSAWSFTTIPSNPVIDPQPQNTYFNAGDPNVVLTLTATTTYPPLTYQWYKGAAIISDGAEYSGTLTDTLVILNPDANDEGDYYCKVTGDNGGITDSDTAIVAEARMVAWYQFEQNVNDSVGTNDANEPAGTIAYTTDVPAGLGSTYAADPNGSGYAQLPAGAYPTVGFGNALNEGTVSFWAKLDSASTQAIMGSFNDGSTQAFQIEANYNGLVRLYYRENDGDKLDCRSANDAANDGEWHYVVVAYRTNQPGASAEIYIDGELSGSDSTTASLADTGAFQYPMVLMARNSRGTVDENFTGMVDDLQIYNYAKTAEEVAQDYYDVTGQSTCILSRYEEASQYDFDENCIFDLSDMAVLFGMWLDTGWYPVIP